MSFEQSPIVSDLITNIFSLDNVYSNTRLNSPCRLPGFFQRCADACFFVLYLLSLRKYSGDNLIFLLFASFSSLFLNFLHYFCFPHFSFFLISFHCLIRVTTFDVQKIKRRISESKLLSLKLLFTGSVMIVKSFFRDCRILSLNNLCVTMKII